MQYHAYGGDDWDSMCSESVQLSEYFNAHPNMTTDAGAVLFGDTVTITADGPWQHLLYKADGAQWGNLDVENETGCGIVPYTYRPSNLVNAVQWAVGLELLLLIDDPCVCSSRPITPTAPVFGVTRKSYNFSCRPISAESAGRSSNRKS